MPRRDDFMAKVRTNFRLALDADQKQRDREKDDLRFFNGEQWDDQAILARKAQQGSNGLPPVPARPYLTINKCREPVNQVLNQERASDMGLELTPADDFGDLGVTPDETEVTLREGLVRRIQRDSQAADARTWAFARAVQAGRGYYGILTRYLPGKTWDQEAYVHRFFDQSSVLLDPAHEMPDGSDAQWAFGGGTLMAWEDYKLEFPSTRDQHNPISTADGAAFSTYVDDLKDWFSQEGDTRYVRVMNYWYTERKKRVLARLVDGSVHWDDELPEGAEPVETRPVIEKTIKWCKIDGVQVLEETDWPGPDIPIIKVLGTELQPVDKERPVEGMVRPARDSQVGFNAMVSKWVETVGLAPIPPLMMAAGQQEGWEAWYQAANTRTLPYLLYNSKDLEGNLPGPPTAAPRDVPIQAIAASVNLFDEAIQSTTGVAEARVGRSTARRDQSGRALQEQRESSEQGTSNFLDNLKRSIRYEGQIINNLLYAIYGRPGRLVRMMNGEGEFETAKIGATTGQPAPAAPMPMGGPPSVGPAGPPVAPSGPKEYKLTKDAHFNVIVKVSRAYDSRRLQESDRIGEMIGANPELITWFGDIYFKNLDGPGHNEMAERAKVMLAPPIQQFLAQKQQGQEIPPQVQAQIAQLTEKVQQAEQIMQTQQQEIQQKTAEQQVKLQIAQIENETKLKIAASEQETRLTIEAQKADAMQAMALMQAQIDRIGAELDHQHAAQQQRGAQAHQAAMAETGAGQQAEEAERARQFEAEQGEAARAAEAQAAEQQAAREQQLATQGAE